MMSRIKTNNVYKLYIGLYPETVYSIVKAYDLLPLSARQCTLVPLYLLWGCPDNVGNSRTGFADGPPRVYEFLGQGLRLHNG